MKSLLLSVLVSLSFATSLCAAAGNVELKKGDHICLIGNALADRMQHDGWLEALIYKAFPEQELVVRNLGFAGDEVTTRTRSENFGTPDEWLTREKADVVLAFFGFNESFGGYGGLEKFKGELEKFLKETRAKNYSGKGAPRLVLFSPIAQEKLADPNLPDPAANNTNLQNYTAAMAEIAKANDVLFVDLFTASQQVYRAAKSPLTFNGFHLTEAGNRALAPVIFKALLNAEPPAADAALEKIRGAVLEKNAMWHSRYRTVDGYNVYGGRSKLSFNNITNFQVMQQEMSVRDVMTANRDRRVWAVAKGGDLAVDDSNVPEVMKVPTNKPGPNPDASHVFLSGEAAIPHMKLPKGCKVNLFASEEQWPLLANPVQMAWDTKGRLWVSAWINYPERTPSSKQGDALLVFEDSDGDGKADKCTPFMDNLNCPTGFQFYKDGVLVMQAPDLWFVKDTNGDGKADWKERVLMGLDSADSHHTTNAMCLDPGGATYLSDGVFHRSQVETAEGVARNYDAAIYRYEPRTSRFETYVAYGFANPHGRVFDRWGNDIVTDATGNANYFGPAFSGRIEFPQKHASMKEFWQRPSRPCPGTGMLSSRHFPDEFNGNFLNCNVISIQGIFRAKVTEDGSGLKGETLEHLVTSDDPNFRPSAVSVGPDGAVYFLDWHNPIIGHMQHHIRDPNRDHAHGRIYRITYEGRELLKPAKIAGEPIEKLLELLKEPEDNVRERAKIELGARDTAQVMAALQKWEASLDKSDPNYEHHLTEVLWVHQWHNVVNEALLRRVLRSPDYHARAAATRVLCYWRDRVPATLALLKAQAADEHPRVRLEAVRAASFFDGDQVKPAVEVAYETLKQPNDYYLDYTYSETLKQLRALSKEFVLPADPALQQLVLKRLTPKELAKAPEVEPVMVMRLESKDVDPGMREQSLAALAKLRGTDRVTEIVASLGRLDTRGADAGVAGELTKALTQAPAPELTKVRPALLALAEKATQPPVRRAAYAALITADAKPETSWVAPKTDPARRALIEAIGFLQDPALRSSFQPLLASALADARLNGDVRSAVLQALPLMGIENAKGNFGVLASSLREGKDRTTAARAIMQLPRESWNLEAAGPTTESILNWAKTVPAESRTAQDFIETIQVGKELATLLPPPEAIRVRKELSALIVSIFVVKTVREQMRYDTPLLVVEAGKPFEIIFENVDAMPHNLVIVQPGAREEVATQAQTMPPDKADKRGRVYVPDNKKILNATKLAEPGQKETLKLTAPQEPGDYEYVCTFPGHWMLMWGKLAVVKNVEAYFQENPTPAPAKPAAAAPIDHSAHQQVKR